MQEVTNLFNRPLILSDGTVLAAHGTCGAKKTVVLAAFDRRLAERGLLALGAEVAEKAVEKALKEK
jgi:hypothetical protein